MTYVVMAKHQMAVDRGRAAKRAVRLALELRRERVEGSDGSAITVELAVQIAMLVERAYRRGVERGLNSAVGGKGMTGADYKRWLSGLREDLSPLLEDQSTGQYVVSGYALERAVDDCSDLPELKEVLGGARRVIMQGAPRVLGVQGRRRV